MANRSNHTAVEYDSFADIYSLWTDTAAAAQSNLSFYIQAYTATDGPIVELGVGDGRIAVEAASRGCEIVGIDVSPAMLALCRQRAKQAGVSDKITLVEADFRNFQLKQPAALIALPYHSFGHLTTNRSKCQAVERIYSQLRPGGRFLFDDFLMTPQLASRLRQVQLRAAYRSKFGTDVLLWVTSQVDEPSQSITVVTWQDDFDADGQLEWRRYRRLNLSWLDPENVQQLLTETGFQINACLGDFTGSAFSADTAVEQIWDVRKPAHATSMKVIHDRNDWTKGI